MVAMLTQKLFDIAEKMAQKEIEKDPIDFIRRESFAGEDRERFFGIESSCPNGKIIPIKEEDEFDPEKYSLAFKEEMKSPLQIEVEKKSSGSDGQEENLEEELEEIFHDANDFVSSDVTSGRRVSHRKIL